MSTDANLPPDLDVRKRRFLLGATGVVGGIGAAAAALPFVMSFFPSERAKAAGAPVEVDISKMEPGQKVDIEWRGKVVWLINRTPEMLATLPKLTPQLADPTSQGSQQPAYAKNETRSIKPSVFVAVGICTHLGCSPTFRKDVAPGYDLKYLIFVTNQYGPWKINVYGFIAPKGTSSPSGGAR